MTELNNMLSAAFEYQSLALRYETDSEDLREILTQMVAAQNKLDDAIIEYVKATGLIIEQEETNGT